MKRMKKKKTFIGRTKNLTNIFQKGIRFTNGEFTSTKGKCESGYRTKINL